MKVVEIFYSIDGEGIKAGFPVVFVRLEGCNLRCSYCDTKYSYTQAQYEELTVDEIFNRVFRYGCKRVTLTGGEPLIHEDVDLLINKLTSEGFVVNIETNGSVDITPYLDNKDVLITADYKCPSSGMEDHMLQSNLKKLRRTDVLKFVVGNQEDLNVCLSLIGYTRAQVFISPVFGQIEPKEIVEYMLTHNMQNCRVQLQLHKFIWNPEMKGV